MSRWDWKFWIILLLAGTPAWGADGKVDISAVLNYRPIQKDVEIETPTAEELPNCRLDVERTEKGSGWVVYGEQGQTLRRFLDTDGDRDVDEYRYYLHGLEVYRDLDTNDNNKVDQHRWLNTAGSRWGVDADEDGTIDSWRVISAEEATREAVLALTSRNVARLQAVLVTAADIKQLGILGATAQKMLENVSDPAAKLTKILGQSRTINAQTNWTRFDCSMLMPNLIPAEEGKTDKDLIVYENVMAIVDTDGNSGFVQIGEMVRVGNVWKLTQIPQPMEGERFELAGGGLLLQPGGAVEAGSVEGLSQKMRDLIDALRDLDEKAPQAASSRDDMARYNVARANLLSQLAEESPTQQERALWQRQRLEGIAAATQMDTFPNGITELRKAEREYANVAGAKDLLAFTVFQRLLAEYNLNLQNAEADDRAKIQEGWIKSLEEYVKQYADSEESSDAMLQLAITHEFNGNVAEARTGYERLVRAYPQSQAGQRANGALRRLGLQGKRLALSGASLQGGQIDISQYRGKVVAVIFWATWCKPCTEELPQIQELHRVYQREGFEVLGVNLDSPGAPIADYIRNFKVNWPHIHETGGLESAPAVNYGVISLPTMFIVDKNGVVASSSASLDELKKLVPELTKK